MNDIFRWRDVTKELPPLDKKVLVTVKYKMVDFFFDEYIYNIIVIAGYAGNGKWYNETGNIYDEVVAWCYLPKPYDKGSAKYV